MHLTQGSGTTSHPRPLSRKGRGELVQNPMNFFAPWRLCVRICVKCLISNVFFVIFLKFLLCKFLERFLSLERFKRALSLAVVQNLGQVAASRPANASRHRSWIASLRTRQFLVRITRTVSLLRT